MVSAALAALNRSERRRVHIFRFIDIFILRRGVVRHTIAIIVWNRSLINISCDMFAGIVTPTTTLVNTVKIKGTYGWQDVFQIVIRPIESK